MGILVIEIKIFSFGQFVRALRIRRRRRIFISRAVAVENDIRVRLFACCGRGIIQSVIFIADLEYFRLIFVGKRAETERKRRFARKRFVGRENIAVRSVRRINTRHHSVFARAVFLVSIRRAVDSVKHKRYVRRSFLRGVIVKFQRYVEDFGRTRVCERLTVERHSSRNLRIIVGRKGNFRTILIVQRICNLFLAESFANEYRRTRFRCRIECFFQQIDYVAVLGIIGVFHAVIPLCVQRESHIAHFEGVARFIQCISGLRFGIRRRPARKTIARQSELLVGDRSLRADHERFAAYRTRSGFRRVGRSVGHIRNGHLLSVVISGINVIGFIHAQFDCRRFRRIETEIRIGVLEIPIVGKIHRIAHEPFARLRFFGNRRIRRAVGILLIDIDRVFHFVFCRKGEPFFRHGFRIGKLLIAFIPARERRVALSMRRNTFQRFGKFRAHRDFVGCLFQRTVVRGIERKRSHLNFHEFRIVRNVVFGHL